eukprot:709479-Pyramimonas_sp.AAC.1
MWRKVNGPVAAIQATFIAAGWKPEQAVLWKRPTQQGDEQWQPPFIDGDGKCGTVGASSNTFTRRRFTSRRRYLAYQQGAEK